MALTGRKRSFADALLAGKTKKQAAIEAGLSEKTAAQAGCRLAKDKDVLAYMDKKKDRKAGRSRKGGFTLPNGQKSPDAPPNWPFGTLPPETPTAPKRMTAKEYLLDVVNDLEMDARLRVDAAKKLLEFEEAKPAPMGKKEAKQEAAKNVAKGRFSAGKAPLALVKR